MDRLVELRSLREGRGLDYAVRGKRRAAHCSANSAHRQARWQQPPRSRDGRRPGASVLVCDRCERVWPMVEEALPLGTLARGHRVRAGPDARTAGGWGRDWRVARGDSPRRGAPSAWDLWADLEAAVAQLEGSRPRGCLRPLGPEPRHVLELDALVRSLGIRRHPRSQWSSALRSWLDTLEPREWREAVETWLVTGDDRNQVQVAQRVAPHGSWSLRALPGYRRLGLRALTEILEGRGMLGESAA